MSASGITARAPSNIALIKYMGKKDASRNLPAHGSLSMTLDRLCSFAEVTRKSGSGQGIEWVADLPALAVDPDNRAAVPKLSQVGISRIARHFEKVRIEIPGILDRFSMKSNSSGAFQLRTANTFPAASGIASSASSFAAVTLAAAAAFSADPKEFNQVYRESLELKRALAALSRQGSGSSCRSFEGPWVLWDQEFAAEISTTMPEMADLVLLVRAEEKDVSSSEAHTRVTHSPLWHGRIGRVENRLQDLEAALGEGQLATVARIAWAEAWEMHSLFHTCEQPFTYWEPGTVALLKWLSGFMSDRVPPIVTLDAGPNVHLIVEARQTQEWKSRVRERFPEIRILEDRQGRGAELHV